MPKSSNEYFTAGKIAKLYGVSQSEVKKIIQALKVKPEFVKAGCSYYSKDVADQIKKHLKK